MLALMLAAFLLALPAQGPSVTLDRFPKDLQLYARDAASQAAVEVAGRVDSPGYSEARLDVYRDGVLHARQTQPLHYAGGSAAFAFRATIQAELANYDFELSVLDPLGATVVARAEDVVAGDAWLIQGQSNAVAGDGHNEGLANALFGRPWVRSYGTASLWGFKTLADEDWGVADGERSNGHCTIGQWGLRLGQILVDRTGVPVAILNGAVGATPIKWHLRNDADPGDVDTNYGRLLHRAQRAGLAGAVRGLFWYQGEADGDRWRPYLANFTDLYRDWLQDFPALERVYLFQVHEGCGGPNPSLRELQRRLGDLFPRVEVLSTTATAGHDGCHYWLAGYRELGDRAARVILADFHGSPVTADIDAPNVARAYYSDPMRSEITLEFRDPDDTLVAPAGVESLFRLHGGTGGGVASVSVQGNRLILRLSGPSTATEVSYDYPSGFVPGITNGRGVGALTFFKLRL